MVLLLLPGLCWSDSSLLLEENTLLCAWSNNSLLWRFIASSPILVLVLSTRTSSKKKPTMHMGVWNSACDWSKKKKKSAWMEEEFKSQCIVRLETSRWHSGAARRTACASQMLWQCLTMSTEQARVKQLRLQGSVTHWGARLTPRLALKLARLWTYME